MTDTDTIISAGYIITDGTLIHGSGLTSVAAWDSARECLEMARVTLLGDDDDTEQHGSWMRLSDLRCHPATAALIDKVDTAGGDVSWSRRDGIACTDAEA